MWVSGQSARAEHTSARNTAEAAARTSANSPSPISRAALCTNSASVRIIPFHRRQYAALNDWSKRRYMP